MQEFPMKKMNHSPLSIAVNGAIAGPMIKPLEAKNSISPKGELLLYGVIGDWWDGMDALTIVRELEQLSGNEIIVRIQSPGGNVTEGLAMYNRLKQSPKKVIVYIDGVAASMGAGVAMAGDEVHIPTNALMMLHKPSLDGVGGNENDLRDLADALAKMEQSYVQIHADKTGKTTEEIKALIADGKNHFFVGQEAVDYGLADYVIDSVQLNATACMKFSEFEIPQKITASLFTKPAAAAAQTQEEIEMIRIKAKKGGWHFVPAINAALNGSYAKIEEAVAALKDKVTVTNLASILDGTAECDNDTLKAIAAEFGIKVDFETEPNPADKDDVQPVDATAAVAQERARVRDLRALAATAKIPDVDLNKWIDSGTKLEAARAAALDVLANRDKESTTRNHVRTHGGDNTKMREAMTNAVLNRVAPASHKLSDDGKEFRGMSLIGMVDAMLQIAGERTVGKTPNELMAMASHTTSDFPLILQDVANITLRAAYAQAPATYKAIAVQSGATDFRAKHSVSIGTGSGLAKVNEHGEFKEGTVSEGDESYRVETYGRIFSFSRQLIINDNIGALTRFMGEVGGLAARKENEIVWGLIKANANMRDGLPLYSNNALRGNLVTGTAVTEAGLAAMRMALRKMKGLDGEALNIVAKYLAIPTDRELEAEKILTAVLANSTGSVNPFANKLELIVEPLLDGVSNNPWYTFADPAIAPAVEYAHLDGQAGPYLETRWGFEVDGMQLKIRHDFGAGVIDFRSTIKNPGV
jgi:ATP-dependent protease ClpP protease subunit